MKLKHLISLAALATLPASASAQTVRIDFETAEGYTALGAYDSWENSPFRSVDGAAPRLEGNAQVVANHLKEVDEFVGEVNVSDKIVGFQRSRYASNRFGLRVDLAQTFELTATTRYLHVMIHKQTAGRVLAIGLGKRADRPTQSKEVEQFAVLSSNSAVAGKWFDAVFPISGSGGIDIYSLVIVPECEPTHAMTADEVAYIDDILVDSSPMPRVTYGTYPINYDLTDAITHASRYTSAVTLTSADGVQTIATNQQNDKLLYQDLTAQSLKAKAGWPVTPAVTFNGTWMCTYVYLDKDNDGLFAYSLNDDGTPAEADNDLLSYSYYNGLNSDGTAVTNYALQPLQFTVPADLEPGFYRLRYKVDWNSIDPGGNTDESNTILANGGAIIDTRLNVHADQVTVSRGQHAEGTNGELLNADGTPFTTRQVPFGQDLTIKVQPADGFRLSQVIVRHGYNLDGDSVVMGNLQYEELVVPASLFRDNSFTIPGKYIDGDVRITPVFPSGAAARQDTDYARNFPDDLASSRTDRKLNSISVTGSVSTSAQTVTVPALDDNLVYRDLTASAEVGAVPGETLTFATDYTYEDAPWMHAYLYVDFGNDGLFEYSLGSDGLPDKSGDLVSYTYFCPGTPDTDNGYNSSGEQIAPADRGKAALVAGLPSFQVPDFIPQGVYRARLKIDWNNVDPAGQYTDGDANNIDTNGGQIVDFLLNVHASQGKLDFVTSNGSFTGATYGGLAPTVAYRNLSCRIVPLGLDENYVASQATIRHGQNLDGEQYIHGNRQWSEYTVDLTSAYSIPRDSINGDVRVTADFVNQGSTYEPVFIEEFDGEDGSQPSTDRWARSGMSYATWKRYTAQTEAGQALTGYIEDGKLVLRCLANPFDDEKSMSGEKGEMISGSFETLGKYHFTYGKVEGRLKTTGHSGNFPAFWMMPQYNTGGWPNAGEIDIWEQIDESTTTHHTIHSHWANGSADGGLGNSSNPPKTGNSTATLGQYHVFGLEWTPTLLTWYVNGKKVFSYAKSENQDDLDNLQWPFDKPFYIIVNQSVGNGGWAANRDLSFIYETLFDWVRVYHSDELAAIDDVTASASSALDFYVQPGKVRLVAPSPTHVSIVDLEGRTLFSSEVQGNRTVTLMKGVYVINGEKILVP